MIVKRKDHPKLNAMLTRVAPINRKHSAILMVAGTIECRSYWSGGSQSSFILVSADGGVIKSLRAQTDPEPFGKFDPEVHQHEIPEGKLVVQLGTFRGKRATPTVYASAETFKQLGIEGVI